MNPNFHSAQYTYVWEHHMMHFVNLEMNEYAFWSWAVDSAQREGPYTDVEGSC